MTPVPRFEDSWEANDRALLRRRLLHLAIACAVVLALLVLATCGPADAVIEGGAR